DVAGRDNGVRSAASPGSPLDASASMPPTPRVVRRVEPFARCGVHRVGLSRGGTMIAVDGVTKLYGPLVAVDGLSFEVGRGEVVGFLGPNGAGKTTTMRMLAGTLQPDAGVVRFDGRSIG